MEKENLEGTGWITTDPAEASRFSSGQWQTADYRAGDVIIFTMRTIHMSTTNTTDKVCSIFCSREYSNLVLFYDIMINLYQNLIASLTFVGKNFMRCSLAACK